MTWREQQQETLEGAVSAVRVRITDGPDGSVQGKIGYLFEYPDVHPYIITVTEDSVRRLHLSEGYAYQLEET